MPNISTCALPSSFAITYYLLLIGLPPCWPLLPVTSCTVQSSQPWGARASLENASLAPLRVIHGHRLPCQQSSPAALAAAIKSAPRKRHFPSLKSAGVLFVGVMCFKRDAGSTASYRDTSTVIGAVSLQQQHTQHPNAGRQSMRSVLVATPENTREAGAQQARYEDQR